jgi:hypothetical protein
MQMTWNRTVAKTGKDANAMKRSLPLTAFPRMPFHACSCPSVCSACAHAVCIDRRKLGVAIGERAKRLPALLELPRHAGPMMLNKRLVLGCLLAICSLLFLASRYSHIEEFDDVALDEPLPPFDPAPELPDKWRPDLQVDRGPARKGPLRVSPRPPSKDPAGSNPKSLPVRLNEDVLPTYRYLSVPSTDDPWPDRPEVADVFFAADRKAHDPPRPVWPDPSAVESSRATRSRLQASDRVRFEDLVPPVPSSSLGARQKLPKVQAEDPPETRQRAQERAQRKQWVERAIRHGWEGYKWVHLRQFRTNKSSGVIAGLLLGAQTRSNQYRTAPEIPSTDGALASSMLCKFVPRPLSNL